MILAASSLALIQIGQILSSAASRVLASEGVLEDGTEGVLGPLGRNGAEAVLLDRALDEFLAIGSFDASQSFLFGSGGRSKVVDHGKVAGWHGGSLREGADMGGGSL